MFVVLFISKFVILNNCMHCVITKYSLSGEMYLWRFMVIWFLFSVLTPPRGVVNLCYYANPKTCHIPKLGVCPNVLVNGSKTKHNNLTGIPFMRTHCREPWVHTSRYVVQSSIYYNTTNAHFKVCCTVSHLLQHNKCTFQGMLYSLPSITTQQIHTWRYVVQYPIYYNTTNAHFKVCCTHLYFRMWVL